MPVMLLYLRAVSCIAFTPRLFALLCVSCWYTCVCFHISYTRFCSFQLCHFLSVTSSFSYFRFFSCVLRYVSAIVLSGMVCALLVCYVMFVVCCVFVVDVLALFYFVRVWYVRVFAGLLLYFRFVYSRVLSCRFVEFPCIFVYCRCCPFMLCRCVRCSLVSCRVLYFYVVVVMLFSRIVCGLLNVPFFSRLV